jgi:hypothetical protein
LCAGWADAIQHVDVAVAVAVFIAIDRAVGIRIPAAQATWTGWTLCARSTWCADWTHRARYACWADWAWCACWTLRTRGADTIQHIHGAITVAIFIAFDHAIGVGIPAAEAGSAGWA